MLSTVLTYSFITMLIALLFAILRLFQGPGLVDRIIIFDLFTSIAIGLMGISFMWLEASIMLDIALLISVIAFVATLGFAKYVETRRSEQ